jgi:drug/metabolite transporter (DMT)-like permease
MNIKKIAGLVLVTAGVLLLVYRGFSYTKESHTGSLGPFDFSVKEKKQVTVPTWAGVAAVVAGVALLVIPGRRT